MTLAPPPAKLKITRADHGRRMTLEDFENADFDDCVRIELSRGVVDVHQYPTEDRGVSDIPGIEHGMIEDRIEQAFATHRAVNASGIKYMGPGSRAKLLIDSSASERHPDFSVYLTDPPVGEQPWADWTPDLVIEIVSDSSRRRDYVDKVADYWEAGVGEYWIVDPQSQQVQVCRRGEGEWTITVFRGHHPITTDRLHGFAMTASMVFAARP